MKTEMYRHGDCLLKRVKEIPKTARKVDGQTIALGEATGHHHTFKQESVQLYKEQDTTFIDVVEPSSLEHQEHNVLQVSPGKYVLVMEREMNHFTEVIQQVQD